MTYSKRLVNPVRMFESSPSATGLEQGILNGVKLIKRSKRIVIGTHIDPDGDGICAALSCAALVKNYKKTKPVLFCFSPIPKKYRFLLGTDKFTNRLTNFDLLILVDSADIARVFPDIDKNSFNAKFKIIINIDHHKSNERFGTLTIIDEKASSACEIIYQIFKKLKLKINRRLAEIFYSGIYNETGGFVYDNTTEKALGIAAQLVRDGLKPAPLVKKLNVKTVQGTLLLSEVLNTIEIKHGIGMMYLTQEMLMKSRACMADSENFISFLQAISGVRVSVFLREEKEGTRLSLRSDGPVDVNKIAQRFGGGGHRLAAGFRMKKDLLTAKRAVFGAILEELNSHSV